MADLGDMKVKIGADLSELLSKVDAAKAKLNQLTESQQGLKTVITDLNASLRLNERELTAANVKLQALNTTTKEGKAAASVLRIEIGQLANNSKLLNTNLTVAKTQLADTTAQIKAQTIVLKEAEAGTSGFAKGATKLYSGLRTLANIIPGIGIGGLVALIAGPLVDAFKDWIEAANIAGNATKLMSDTLDASAGKYATAVENVSRLKEEIKLAKEGFLDKDKVIKDYNESIGKTTGFVHSLDEAEKALNKNAEAYIKFTFLKAVANEANAASAKKAVEAALAALKPQAEFVTQGQALGQSLVQSFVHPFKNTTDLLVGAGNRLVGEAEKNRKKVIDSANSDSKALLLMAKKFGDEAAALAKQFKFNPFEDNKGGKSTGAVKDVESINDVLEKLRIQIDFLNNKEILLKTDEAKSKISAIESTIDHLLQKFKLASDNPIILNLEAKINDIQLTEEFKKVLKFDKTKPIVIPQEIQLLMLPPDIKFPPGTFDEAILRDAMIAKLKAVGIDKTIPIQIGLDITGLPLIADLSEGLDTASFAKILATFAKFFKNAKKTTQDYVDDFNKSFKESISQIGVDAFSGLGEAIGNAFGGGTDIFKGLFDGIFSSLAGELANLGKILIKTGIEMKIAKDAFKKLFKSPLAFIAAGIGLVILSALIKKAINNAAPGLAKGGEIKGRGSGTSDSVLIRASAGEYVIREEVVKKLGVPFFQKINQGVKPLNYAEFMAGRGYPKFSSGGLITPNITNNQQGDFSVIRTNDTQVIIPEIKVRGQDLILIFNRANATINRNS